MATYNPSVYDDAYTVLKKICNVEKWLKDHPQLAIGKTSVELWNDDELGEIAKNTVLSGVALSIGDVILVDHYILDGELDGTKLFHITAEDATKWYGSLIGELQRGPQGLRGPQGIQGPQGPAGDDGADGADGVGVPTGGTTGQVLKKKSNTDYDTEWGTDTGMNNPMTSAGDMIFAGAGGLPLALGKGTAGQVLKMDSYGAGPEWATDTQGAAGDALAASAAGADEGQILTADGGGGTTWATPPSPGMNNPMTAAGDLIVGGSYGVPARLGKGTAGQVLKMNSGATAPEWGTDAGAAGDAFAAAMTNSTAVINAAVSKVANIDSTAAMIDAAASAIDEAATANVGDVLTADSNGEASWQTPAPASGVAYLTTAPSAANTAGDLKFVVLSAEPATYYNGYYYIITGA